MEVVWDKIGAIVGAIITALGGFYMYDRKVTHERLTRMEDEVNKNKIDIRIIETKFSELKEDTEEIKESQKLILELLTRKRR